MQSPAFPDSKSALSFSGLGCGSYSQGLPRNVGGQVFIETGCSQVLIVSTTNRYLPRALPMTEQQRHLPSASMEIKPYATIAVNLQQPLREFRVERGTLCSRESGGTGL